MRARAIFHIVGSLIAGLGATMFLASLVSLLYAEEDLFALLMASIVTSAVGLILFFITRRAEGKIEVGHRGAFAVVTFGWLSACILGALPFFFYAHLPIVWNGDAPVLAAGVEAAGMLTQLPDCEKGVGLGKEFCSFTNAVFESTSGFTTTGATILEEGLWDDPASRRGGLPHGLLFWRALTHFLGGMGIIVFGVALLPLLGVGGMQLFKAEVPGPVKDKMAPRVAETARLLWTVYAGLTLAEFALLLGTGQGPFLALCHSFATMATGGFSPLSASLETLNSPATEWIVTFFMFLAGANFALHFNSLRRKRMVHWKDQEFRFYLALTVTVALLLFFSLWQRDGLAAGEGIRAAAFQTASIITTTGFSSQDFVLWGVGSKVLIFLLFFTGGCSGSTGGGIKCMRVFIMVRLAITELKRLVHPRAIIQTKLSGNPVPVNIINSVAGFITLYLLVYLISVLVFALNGHDFETSVTAAGATLGNIGPGFGKVGPALNYNFFSDGVKWHQVFLMLIGRLELYSVLIVLTPEFWRK